MSKISTSISSSFSPPLIQLWCLYTPLKLSKANYIPRYPRDVGSFKDCLIRGKVFLQSHPAHKIMIADQKAHISMRKSGKIYTFNLPSELDKYIMLT